MAPPTDDATVLPRGSIRGRLSDWLEAAEWSGGCRPSAPRVPEPRKLSCGLDWHRVNALKVRSIDEMRQFSAKHWSARLRSNHKKPKADY